MTLYKRAEWEELGGSPALFVYTLTSNSSFKAHNRAYTLRTISSNIIHHPEGRSELRDAIPCEIDF